MFSEFCSAPKSGGCVRNYIKLRIHPTIYRSCDLGHHTRLLLSRHQDNVSFGNWLRGAKPDQTQSIFVQVQPYPMISHPRQSANPLTIHPLSDTLLNQSKTARRVEESDRQKLNNSSRTQRDIVPTGRAERQRRKQFSGKRKSGSTQGRIRTDSGRRNGDFESWHYLLSLTALKGTGWGSWRLVV